MDTDTVRRPSFALVRTESTFEEIPVIDFSQADSTDPTIRRELADLIRDACINVGFFYIKNHSIPADVIKKTLEAAKDFFSLPDSVKMKIDIHNTSNYKGYTALLGEKADPEHQLGDLHEGFDLGWEPIDPSEGVGLREDGAMTGENVWPDTTFLPGFRDAVLEYYHAAIRLGKSLFPLFALALDLQEDFFDDKITKPAAIMRLLHYPPQNLTTVDEDGRVIGIGTHTDYECFTILWQDNVPALQVQNANGKWIDAPPIPGTLVLKDIILGILTRPGRPIRPLDKYEICLPLLTQTIDSHAHKHRSDDVFKSTLHRAINRSGKERYSIPLFFGTDYDVPLEPFPGCVSDDRPAKYEVVTAGEYVKSRLEATYAHSAPGRVPQFEGRANEGK